MCLLWIIVFKEEEEEEAGPAFDDNPLIFK